MKTKNYRTTSRKSVRARKRVAVSLILLILIALGVGSYLIYRHYHYKTVAQTIQSAGQGTKGQVNQPTNSTNSQSTGVGGVTNSSSSGTSKTSNSSPTNSSQPTATLIAPTGNFISSDSATSSSQMSSVCETTAGATCQITFTSNGTVLSLPAKTTDSNGDAYWFWMPKNYKITAGSWAVTAIAKLGDQTQSTNNAQNLEVSQ